MQETWVRSLGWEDPLEKEMATHSSILAWRSPWTEEPGGSPTLGAWHFSYWITREVSLLNVLFKFKNISLEWPDQWKTECDCFLPCFWCCLYHCSQVIVFISTWHSLFIHSHFNSHSWNESSILVFSTEGWQSMWVLQNEDYPYDKK